MRHLATHPTDRTAAARLVVRDQNALYRVLLVGGPLDGHDEASPQFPAADLELRSGPASGCGTRAGTFVVQRLAQYRLESTQLCLTEQAPFVECRYTYQGTVAGRSPGFSLWKTCLQLVRRACRRTATSLARRTAYLARRSIKHVQD